MALRVVFKTELESAASVTIKAAFIPGINDWDYAASGARVVTNFVPSQSRSSFETGRHDLLPLHYSDLTRYFAESGTDCAILHCPPDRDGKYSLGLNADFAFAAATAARSRLFIINPNLPWTEGHATLDRREGDSVVEDDSPLLRPVSDTPDEVALSVASKVAALVRDGDTIQTGIGRVPSATLNFLGNHRRLRIHSGIITDEVLGLVGVGALRLGDKGALVSGSAWGGSGLHELVANAGVTIAPASFTHDLRRVGGLENFVAINSALEVDLLGQVNGEVLRGRRVSGIGGANDFARGARMSHGGRSIIALPSTAGQHSRIVLALIPGSVTQAAADADIVVTEHGVATLRDLTLDERAEALVAVAAPSHRSELAKAWRDWRARM